MCPQRGSEPGANYGAPGTERRRGKRTESSFCGSSRLLPPGFIHMMGETSPVGPRFIGNLDFPLFMTMVYAIYFKASTDLHFFQSCPDFTLPRENRPCMKLYSTVHPTSPYRKLNGLRCMFCLVAQFVYDIFVSSLEGAIIRSRFCGKTLHFQGQQARCSACNLVPLRGGHTCLQNCTHPGAWWPGLVRQTRRLPRYSSYVNMRGWRNR